MTFQEVKELHEMGFTPEQITQLNLGSDPEPQPEQQTETKQEPQQEQQPEQQPDTKPEPDPVSQKLESMEKTINDFIVAMQKNNLKTASVNLLPDDQIDAGANTALSELIRPTIKQKED
jgi:hypothetical protein